jgi:hypothetical protein
MEESEQGFVQMRPRQRNGHLMPGW